MSTSLEEDLHTLIVLEGKYKSQVEVYNDVLSLLKEAEGSPRPATPITTRGGGKFYRCCCAIPLCIGRTPCVKWIVRIMIFFWLLVSFTGVVAYFIDLVTGNTK